MMKKMIIIFLSWMFPMWIFAQDNGEITQKHFQFRNQFIKEVNVLADVVGDCVMSFFDNPYHHSNTKKIYDLMKNEEKMLKEYKEKYLSLGISDDNTYYMINNCLKYVKIVSALTGGIGYNYLCRFDSNDFETMVMPVLSQCGWEWKVVASSDYAIVYEFQMEKFRMILVKNILVPTPTLEQEFAVEYNGNMVHYELFHYNPILKREECYLRANVYGGKYTLGRYIDDESTREYYKTTKVISEVKR